MPSPKLLLGIIVGILSSVAARSAAPLFQAETIDDKISIGYGLAIADVNGDKKPDILLADQKEIVWYQNPSWEKHVIVQNLTTLDNVCIAAQDIDGDGKCEIAAGAGWNPGDTVNSGAVFYLIPPDDRTQKWTPVPLHHEPTVHRMWWVRDDSGKYNLVVAPLHGRGNKNAQGEGSKLLQYIKPENPHDEWKTFVINNLMHMTHNFDPVQWDDDKAEEILYCGREGILLLDPKTSSTWATKQLVNHARNPDFLGAGEVRLGHSGKEKIIAAIEPMHGTNVVVYTPKPTGEWQRHLVDDSVVEGHGLACADLLGMGKDQIVAGWRGKNKNGEVGIKIYASKEDGTWSNAWVDHGGMACEDLKVSDLNGDGKPEIIAAGRATKNVKIYWNGLKEKR